MTDLISRQEAIDALWKALYEYEDKTEKQFQESEDLDVGDWILHRIFVQNMSDIDIQTILDLPSAKPVRHGKWVHDEFGSKCEHCGLYAYRDKFNKPWESPYCPNCGASMDEDIAEPKEEPNVSEG